MPREFTGRQPTSLSAGRVISSEFMRDSGIVNPFSRYPFKHFVHDPSDLFLRSPAVLRRLLGRLKRFADDLRLSAICFLRGFLEPPSVSGSVGRNTSMALGGLEIQLAGAYELVELPLKRIFHIGVPGQCFCRLGQRLRMELERPTTAELSDQPRNPRSCTA
jgi:hypothetical protein